MHDISSPSTSRSSGGFYIGDASHDIDVGWTIIDDSCILSTGCHTNKPFEVHSTGKFYNSLPAPIIQTGDGTHAGDVLTAGGGSLPPGTYDVFATYRSRIYYNSFVPDSAVPGSSQETETDTTSATVKVTLTGGTGSTAIQIKAPTGYDHLKGIYSPLEEDGVSTLCNPALAYKVYACLENGGSCTPLYQGETTYTTPTAPNTSTAGDYLLASLTQSGHPYVTPQGNFGTPVTAGQAWRAVQAGCNIYNLAFHDSKIINAPGYSLTWAELGANKGYIRVYNNQIINSGNNWNWNVVGDSSVPLCLNFQDPISDDGHEPAPGGDIEFYNNTFYNCGNPKSGFVPGVFSASWRNPNFPTRRFIFRNNIFVQPQQGQTWLADTPNPLPANLQITGSNNLCWGFGGADCTGTGFNSQGGGINRDPLFTNAGTLTIDPAGIGSPIFLGTNLQPLPASPVIDAGFDTTGLSVGRDVLGVLRPQNGIVDIGPFENFAGLSADLVPPTVSLSSPAGGTVTGTITLTATCSDNLAVSTLQFTIDGSNFGGPFTGGGQHSRTLNTGALTTGSHNISALCTDSSGNTATAPSVAISTADTVPPVVSISSPASGSVSGTITLTATCTDNSGVKSLQFTVDGSNFGTAFTSSGQHSLTLDTTTLSSGTHTISAICTDTSNNSANAAAVSITGGRGGQTTADFTLQVASGMPTSATVTAGATATYPLTLSQTTAASNSVTFACNGLPQGAACSASPSPVSLFVGSVPATLSISTTARPAASASMFQTQPTLMANFRHRVAGGLSYLALTLFPGVGLVFIGPRRRRRLSLIVLGVIVGCLLALAGCGGAGGGPSQPRSAATPGTPAGTYNVTVTATAGTITHTLSLQLKVN